MNEFAFVFCKEKGFQDSEPSIRFVELKVMSQKLQNTNGKKTAACEQAKSLSSTFSSENKTPQSVGIDSKASQGAESLRVGSLWV